MALGARHVLQHSDADEQGTTGPDAPRNHAPGEVSAAPGPVRDESTSIYRVLEVAQGLRYRNLDALIGTVFVAQSPDLAERDFLQAVHGYLDEHRAQGPLLPLGTATHRAYGYLDLALPAKRHLLGHGPLQGVALLEWLGFLSGQQPGRSLRPHDFEVLASDIRQAQATLCLLLQDEGWHDETRAGQDDGGGHSPAEYHPVFPLRFKIVDACIANSHYVWRWKHSFL